MIELTLSTLLNTMSTDFCMLMSRENDIIKSTLIAFSLANEKYGPSNVRRVISNSNHIKIKALAVSSVISKCPNQL